MKNILLATRNKGKIAELQTLLRSAGVAVLSLDDIAVEIAEPEETGTTFVENAVLKARYYAKHARFTCLADDSGLSVNALDGRPGVYSARYIPGSDEDRCRKILEELGDQRDRGAQFDAVIAYVDPESGNEMTFSGVVRGTIATELRGEYGFGYDPIFIPEGYTETMAELGADVKNAISHRRRALDRFIAWYEGQQ